MSEKAKLVRKGGNVAKPVLNAFTSEEVKSYTGLSVPMIDYLSRSGYLIPTYGQGRVRGRVRYYSYRDLVVAKAVKHLTDTGVELSQIKKALRTLKRYGSWFSTVRRGSKTYPVEWLVSDGDRVYLQDEKGFLLDLKPGGQLSFGFVICMPSLRDQVRDSLPLKKREHFSLENHELMFVNKKSKQAYAVAK